MFEACCFIFIHWGRWKKKEKEKSNITSREIKWKKGRLTRLGCGGIESFLQVCEVFFNSSSLILVNASVRHATLQSVFVPIGSLLQFHGRIQCLQPALELFHWQNAGRKNHLKRKKGKKKFQKEKENENEKGICQTRKLKENKMK